MFLLTVLALILLSSDRVLCGVCPPADEILPCTCDGATIRCFATHDFDLDSVFERIGKDFLSGQNYFDTFTLESSIMDTLPEDVFHGVVFRRLQFKSNGKLACLSKRAFTGLAPFVQVFESLSTDFSKEDKDCSLFSALSTLTQLVSVSVVDSGLTAIPDNAFSGKNGQQINLQSIDFSSGQGGKIATIGKRAFATLKNLLTIDLSEHLVATISPYAFAFNDQSFNFLTINLAHNPLTDTSFGADSLDVNGRMTSLKLRSCITLKVLDETVFTTFLQQKNFVAVQNSIDLEGSPLTLTKTNLWLIEEKTHLSLQTKVTHAVAAEDGVPIWNHPKSAFK